MRLFAHIFKTWLLAQLLHPLMMIIYIFFFDSVEPESWISAVFFIFIFSLFASIPSLIIAWILLYVISNAELASGEKLIAWFVCVMAAIVFNFILVSIATGEVIDSEIYELLPPPLAAAVLSILVRVESFFQFQSNYKMNR